MSLIREVKPRNARTARIVKAREPQILEGRKKVLLLHGPKCPMPIQTVLKTLTSLTKPHNVVLHKKNENIHPFEDPSSLEFLAQRNECGLVVFATHAKKRPNTVTLLRTFDNKILDVAELLLLTSPDLLQEQAKLEIPGEMRPLVLFAGSQWDDSSTTSTASLYRTLKSIFLDLFSGQEVTTADVAGLQYLVVIAAGELPASTTTLTNPLGPDTAPVLHVRWYKLRTLRSSSPKTPRVELDPIGPQFDFRVGRHKVAEEAIMQEALKRARPPNEARNKKNLETDRVGDKLGRVHLGRQDLSTLQTRKMRGLKRSRGDSDDELVTNGTNGDDDVDQEMGGMELEEVSVSDQGSMASDNDDPEAVAFVDEDGEDDVENDEMNELPKRQRLG